MNISPQISLGFRVYIPIYIKLFPGKQVFKSSYDSPIKFQQA